MSMHIAAGLTVLVTTGTKKFGDKAEPKFLLTTATAQPKLTLQTWLSQDRPDPV
jgi:hypothetical protein